MGSSNRDYMQDDYDAQQVPPWAHDTPTTKWLLIITVVVFFLQSLLTHDTRLQGPISEAITSTDSVIRTISRREVKPVARAAFGQGFPPSYLEEWFALDASDVLHGQVWRLVTYVFLHHRGSALGLVFNMLGLWFLGTVLERMYGSRELLWFYLTSGAVCGLIFTMFGLKMDLPLPMMGAQSSVMALFTLFATHFPRQEILFAWIIPVQIRVLLAIFIALDIYSIMNAYSGITPWIGVAYGSQIWGVAFGYLYRRMNWRLSRFEDLFDFQRMQKSMRKASTARTLKVFHPEPTANLDEQVDAILAKIHEHGSESLTDRERSILQKASERAKNRL